VKIAGFKKTFDKGSPPVNSTFIYI